MAKNNQNVGIVGKYGARYGAPLRKIYARSFCGKTKMKRRAVGIWLCGSCMKTAADGTWTYDTTSVVTVKPAIRRPQD
ncbi:hypothetical protein FD754_000186 [Muntiacus muntjak]|uniref:60S ribosomal protein L37a n=1 Tax=Muntiacus muntjak TaxID=9888 RepID=A0A5N3W2W6_MUNMU|nr:hypothetical protein FD754_000186 [Muntiacus muntjak]